MTTQACMNTQHEDGMRFMNDDGSAILSTFVSSSTMYFILDIIYVFGNLAAGKKVHLWGERLGHHFLQMYGNYSSLSYAKDSRSGSVVKSALAFAYLAETSQF